MRITYLGPVPPLRGGIAQHGAQIVSALVRCGHDVTVESWGALYPRRLYPVDQQPEPGATTPPFTDPPLVVRTTLAWNRPWSWWAAGTRARRGDLVVFPWWVPAQAPAVRTFLTAAGDVPKVGMMHDVVLPNRHRGDWQLARMALRPINAAVVHNDHIATQLRQLLGGLGSDAIAKVGHPPNLPITAQPLPPVPPVRLLVFGHVRSYKGLDLVFDAMRVLDARGVDCTLTVAGQFWQPLEPWRQLITDAGLTGRVDLHAGYIPDRDVDALFAAHHLVLTPYRSASQSGVVPLAAAAGRPSVVTPVGGLVEQVTDGVDAVVAAGVSAGDLADAIETAAGNLDALSAGAQSASVTWEDVAGAITGVATRR